MRSLVAAVCAVALGGFLATAASAAIVADMGFRPNPNGFSFGNYGNDSGYKNLTSSEMQRLFGSSVCANHVRTPAPEPAPTLENGPSNGGRSSASPTPSEPTEPAFTASAGFAADPAPCSLAPDAQAWMDAQNKGMGGGHCNGFAVLAEALYKNQNPFEPFGSGSTYSYSISNDARLQRAIAYGFVYQDLKSVVSKRVRADANTILSKLYTALNPSNHETYTLGIYKPDGSGGHAITPYAIEDLGGGMKAIDVYDNNYPNEARQVLVDTTANTWSYSGASNPALKRDLYGPSPKDPNFEIDPTTPGQGVQPAQFGRTGGSVGAASDAGAAATANLDTVKLAGNLHYHAHLVITDGPRHRVGVIGGSIVNTFPGAYVQPVLQFSDYHDTQEPVYLIPARNVMLTIDGTNLKRTDTETLSDVGNGQDVVVENLKLNPGQKDALQLIRGAANFTFTLARGKRSGSPVLRIGGDGARADVALTLKIVNVRPGATIHVKINEAKQRITFYSTHNKGSQTFVLSAVKQTKQATYVEGSARVTLHGRQSVTYSYVK